MTLNRESTDPTSRSCADYGGSVRMHGQLGSSGELHTLSPTSVALVQPLQLWVEESGRAQVRRPSSRIEDRNLNGRTYHPMQLQLPSPTVKGKSVRLQALAPLQDDFPIETAPRILGSSLSWIPWQVKSPLQLKVTQFPRQSRPWDAIGCASSTMQPP